VRVLGLQRPLFVVLVAAAALYCWYRSKAWLGLALALVAGEAVWRSRSSGSGSKQCTAELLGPAATGAHQSSSSNGSSTHGQQQQPADRCRTLLCVELLESSSRQSFNSALSYFVWVLLAQARACHYAMLAYGRPTSKHGWPVRGRSFERCGKSACAFVSGMLRPCRVEHSLFG
jgi:hypothetical protein